MSKFFNLFKGKKSEERCSVRKRNGHKVSNILDTEINGLNGCEEKRKSDQIEGQNQSKNASNCLSSCPNGTDDNGLDASVATVTTNGSTSNGNVGYTVPSSGITSQTIHMPSSKDNPYYKMDHPSRGKAVIFNFEKWDNTGIPALSLKPRHGSEKDKTDLHNCLLTLDFDVYTHDNLDNLEFWKVLQELKEENHSSRDCLLVAIMTHGEKNHIFVKDGTLIPVNLVWEYFEADKCPSLAGKPKIFIIQACRGRNYDNGHRLRYGSQEMSPNTRQLDVTDSGSFSYVIPNAADILVAFSCPEGQYSWRHPEDGSWFIQAICDVFNKEAYNMDISSLFTCVAREVALNKESYTNNVSDNKKKQVTSTTSTLIRFLRFQPKASAYIPIRENANIIEERSVSIIREAQSLSLSQPQEPEHRLTITTT